MAVVSVLIAQEISNHVYAGQATPRIATYSLAGAERAVDDAQRLWVLRPVLVTR